MPTLDLGSCVNLGKLVNISELSVIFYFMRLKEKTLKNCQKLIHMLQKNPFVQYAILNGQLGEENVKYAVGNLSSFRLG